MTGRPALLAALALAGLLAPPALAGAPVKQSPPASTATAAPPPVPTVPKIAAGTVAGGVDLSGLSVRQAAAKLKSVLTPHVQRDLVLGVAGHAWRLAAADTGVKVNATRTAEAALATPSPDVPVTVSHASAGVDAFVRRIAAKVYVAPRDAAGRITLRHIRLVRGRDGRALATTRAAAAVNAALDDFKASRVLHQRLTTLRPRVTTAAVRRQYGTVLTVEKATFTVRLFKRMRFVKRYLVAIGMPGHATPEGLFHILDKQVNPVWSVPNSPWAGELQGTTVEGGSAANPLKARWMGIGGGVGFHGTGEDASIGTAASHGCLRMHVADVIDLYGRVPVGTPVLIR